MDLTPDAVRAAVPEASNVEATALADWYAALSRAVAAFPAEQIRSVEPPLRSTPGPT